VVIASSRVIPYQTPLITTTQHLNPNLISSISNQQKTKSHKLLGKLPFSSLDLSHQTTLNLAITWIKAYTAGFERWFYYQRGSNHWHECIPLHHSADYTVMENWSKYVELVVREMRPLVAACYSEDSLVKVTVANTSRRELEEVIVYKSSLTIAAALSKKRK
jgi:hypothetical protein